MSQSKYNTNRILAQVVFGVIGTGVVFGGIWVICRVVNALLTLAGVA